MLEPNLIVSLLTLLAILVFGWMLIRGGRGSEDRRIEKQLADLRHEVGKDVESVREQNRIAFEHTTKILGQELGASREEVGKLAVGLRQEIDKKLGETVAKNLEHFSAVTDKLGKLHEATGQIVELSKGIHDLNVLLKTPAGRGAFGELTLEQMLKLFLGAVRRIQSGWIHSCFGA